MNARSNRAFDEFLLAAWASGRTAADIAQQFSVEEKWIAARIAELRNVNNWRGRRDVAMDALRRVERRVGVKPLRGGRDGGTTKRKGAA